MSEITIQSGTSATKVKGNSLIMRFLSISVKNYTMVIALLLIWVLFGILTNGIFFRARNLSNLFRQMTIIGFLSIGMVLVIVTGNIDLSIGSVAGFVSVVAALLQAQIFPVLLPNLLPNSSTASIALISSVLTIALSLLVGLLVGVWQGTIISYLRVPAFIVTLGGMLIFRGGILGVTQGKTITPIEDPLRLLAQGYISKPVGSLLALIIIGLIFFSYFNRRRRRKHYGFELAPLYKDMLKAGFFSALVALYVIVMNSYRGLQTPVLVLAGTAVFIAYMSFNTRFGRYAYAIGGNVEATRYSGIDIKKNIFQVFILMGLLCGVAGFMLTGYVAAGTPTAGLLFELDAIAACVIGGTSLAGGEGKIFGALVGALIIASLINGMSVMNLDILWQYIARGLVLIIAVYLDVNSRRGRA